MAIRFIGVLKEFRSIIIQYLALLLKYGTRLFAMHPIARDPGFQAFKEEVKEADEKHNQLNPTSHSQEAIDGNAPRMALIISAQLNAFEELRGQLTKDMATALTDKLSDQIPSLSQKQTQSVKSLMEHTWAAVGFGFIGFVDGTFGDKTMSKIIKKFDKIMPHYIDQDKRVALSKESSAAAEEST